MTDELEKQNKIIDSELAEAKEQLFLSDQRYSTLTANVPLGIYRRTPGAEGKLIMVNPALVKMFGYSSAEELNEVPVTNLYYNPAECEAFSRKLFTHGEVIREKLKMSKADGTPFWIAVTTTAICDSKGVPLFFDGIMEDITSRLKMDQERENQQRQLMQADKMISLGILVSGVAHEINNPNQFVVSHIIPIEKAFTDALPVLDRYYDDYGDFKMGGLPYQKTRERLPKMFENIKEGTKRITNIVNDLREYAKEHPVDHTEDIDVNKVVKAALVLLQNLIRKSSSGFYVNYGKNIPEVIADFQKIEQVVINLVQNACQSLGDKPLEISITTFLSDKKDEVCIQVNDTGKGISKDNIGRVTDPFFTTKRGEGGTGLGLSISNSICAAFGGRLEFLSEEGEGTTARVWLPAKN